MKQIILLICIFTFCCLSCQNDNAHQNLTTHFIPGRDNTPLYKIKSVNDWVFENADSNNVSDTTKPIGSFFIRDDLNEIRITIHNFPLHTLEERIPPMSQIMRWKKQFDHIKNETVQIKPQSFAGYTGLFFEATGEIKNQEITFVAWSMQLSPSHFQILSNPQVKADYTIKATGPKRFMEKHKHDIIAFARSFELIDEIGNHP